MAATRMIVLLLLFLVNTIITCHGAVYVNSHDGSDTSLCGGPSSPCKTLSAALKIVPQSEEVYATGRFYIRKTFKLSKNVTIIGYKEALILRRANKGLKHVFEISSSIKVSFISLKVYRVGLVVIKESASIVISKCRFVGTTYGKSPSIYGLYPKQTIHVNMTITSTSFLNQIHAPLEIDSKKRSKSLTDLIIMKCVFNNTGASHLSLVTNAVIQDTTFSQNNGFQLQDVYHGQMIKIQRCQFLGGGRFGLSVIGFTYYSQNELIIADTVFTGRQSNVTIEKFGNVTIKNCIFSKIKVDNYVSPVQLFNNENNDIFNMTCEGNKAIRKSGGCLRFRVSRKLGTLFVNIRRSSFINNIVVNANGGAIYAKCFQKSKCSMKISETLFSENLADEGGSIVVNNLNIFIKDCSFMQNRARTNAAALKTEGRARYSLHIEDSRFIGCYSSAKGAALVITGQTNMKIQNSSFQNKGVHVVTQFYLKSIATIHNASFTNCTAPSIYLHIFKIELRNITSIASSETLAPHMQLEGGDVTLQSIDMKTTYSKPIQSNIKQQVMSIVSNSLRIDGISVSCSPNFNAEVNIYPTERKTEVSCETCQPNMYTLFHKLYLQRITNDTVKNLPKCLDCPSGAVCDGHVKVIENYWGKNVGNELHVMPCPDGYCCSSHSTPCTSYNTCSGPRTGTLCGTCSDGYVQRFMNDGCVPRYQEGECNQHTFVTYFIISSLGYTLCLTFLPSVFEMLKEMLMRSTKSSSGSFREEEPDRTDGQVISSAGPNEVEMNYGAYFTLVMFFFQIVSVVNISLPRKTTGVDDKPSSDSGIKKMVFEIFNFQLSLRAKICPMVNLTMIEKLLINIGLKLSTLLHLLWILLTWKFIVTVKICIPGLHSQARSTVLEMTDEIPPRINEIRLITAQDRGNAICDKMRDKLSFPSLIKIGLLKLVKLNYTSAASLLFQLVHCERIGNQFHLYVYGDYICYQWWQMLIFSIILPILILFPISFRMSLDLLKERKISTNWFLSSCGLPFVNLWLQLRKRLGQLHKLDFTNNEERCIEEILSLEEELFVSADKGMRWPVVQLYRNLLIVVLDIYILNSEYKILWYLALFVSFAMHDRFRKPFKHPYLNALQLLTSISLFAINLCNIPAAFSSYGDVLSVPKMNICLTVLTYIQYSLYVFVPLSFPLWKMYRHHEKRTEKSAD